MNRRFTKVACVLVMLVMVAGCARDKMIEVSSRASVAAPQPPPVLTSPAALLLTNAPSFSAHLEFEGNAYSGSGALFGLAGKLLFVPEGEKKDKHVPAGRFSFIWDVSKNQGWLLSDSLQGYAPMTLSGMGHATNLVVQPISPEGARSGATPLSVVASMNDGKEMHFQAVLAAPPHRFPVSVQGGEPPFNATFSKVNFKAPQAAMFELPEGFTAYNSAEAMVDELATRYRNLKRKVY